MQNRALLPPAPRRRSGGRDSHDGEVGHEPTRTCIAHGGNLVWDREIHSFGVPSHFFESERSLLLERRGGRERQLRAHAACYMVDLFINQRTTEVNPQNNSQGISLDRAITYGLYHENLVLLLYKVLPVAVQKKEKKRRGRLRQYGHGDVVPRGTAQVKC